MKGYSEDALVERPAIALFEELGWEWRNCFRESFGPGGSLGRETAQEVVLLPRLRGALGRLNPGLPGEALDRAVAELTRDRSALHPVVANREVFSLVREGVRVPLVVEGEERVATVRVVDWAEPGNNEFFLASQFWLEGEVYRRRADLVGFVNGLPLLLVELKAVHRNLRHAFDENLRDYKAAVPRLFWYNAFIILSNGGETRVGTLTAPWEHFAEWKKVEREEEPGVVSLATALRGTCARARFLDLVENFILFSDVEGALVKILAKYHQYLGVNNAMAALERVGRTRGRLGVFWHTQGSGKSYSMIFFSRKVLRKVPGRWTFVVVTDRQELDEQIYKNFAGAGVVTEPNVHARSARHLRQLLRGDHRFVFTLIHKFRSEDGRRHPVLSDREDVIVMADEAHRTQYDVLAKNMRDALPRAAFLAFTGTPLIAGEEKTRAVFGEYVSVYDFRQSWEDRSTVPLYYENRIPELQLTNEAFNEEMERLLDEAALDEEEERRLEREFARQYHLITRDDRLERIAEDIVAHFMGRGTREKAMVVSIDKATAVRMYDKVRRCWAEHLSRVRAEREALPAGPEREELDEKVRFMEATDMAVVVSQGQNEVEEMRRKGLDILPHRRRLLEEDLASRFKKADDPLRIVFVCAMWMTGFDVPSCSTIYLDKPMRNHTLMQTIARANRVFPHKVNGLIVDYVGVFRNLQRALAIYASGRGEASGRELPVMPKEELVGALRSAIGKAEAFCAERGVALGSVVAARGFERVRLIKDAAEAILENDEAKRRYLSLAADVIRLFRAILPDGRANEFVERRNAIAVIAERIKSLVPQPDISGVMEEVEGLLDRSVAAEAYVIRESEEPYDRGGRRVDLSRIDFDTLRRRFAEGRKRTEAERLRATLERAVTGMVRVNRTRVDFQERLERMIDEYNSGSLNVETFFERLVAFARDLKAEEQRAIAENLSEEELAIVDLLTKPDLHLTAKERAQVKKVARDLLQTLKQEKLVLDWRKRQQSRAQVRVAIEEALDRALPEKYTRRIFTEKCEAVYQHVYDSYPGAGQGAYGSPA